MKKIFLTMLIISIIGLVYSEFQFNSINCQEIYAEVKNITEEQVKEPVHMTQRGEVQYNTRTIYNIEVNVGNSIHQISYPKAEIIENGQEIKVIKYNINGEEKIGVSKMEIRREETLFLVSIITLIISAAVLLLYWLWTIL